MDLSEGHPTASSVKSKLQGVLKDLEKYQDLYRKTCQELEMEREIRTRCETELKSLSVQLNDSERECIQLASKLRITTEKLQEAIKAADESEKARRTMDHRRAVDEDRIAMLETVLRDTSEAATECERKYEEVTRKLMATEADVEKSESRADSAEQKSKHMQQDMHAVTARLKSMTANVDKMKQREDMYNMALADLQARLKASECRASTADGTVQKLQVDVDRLQDELVRVKHMYQSLQQRVMPGYSHEIPAM